MISIVSWLWSVATLVVLKIGRQLVLCGRDLVVLGLGQHAQLPQLFVQFLHIGRNAGLDRAEVMIVQLLTLGGFCAEERAAGVDQIAALFIKRICQSGNTPAPGRRW